MKRLFKCAVLCTALICVSSVYAAEDRPASTMTDRQRVRHYVIAGVVLIALPIAGLWLFRKVGVQCACGARMQFFDELNSDDQDEIRAHFTRYEGGMPGESQIYACPDCLKVRDRFNPSRDYGLTCRNCGHGGVRYLADVVARHQIEKYAGVHPAIADTVECLHCEREPLGEGDCIMCKTEHKAAACRRCKTIYLWMVPPSCRFTYRVMLTPGLELT